MAKKTDYKTARDLLLSRMVPLAAERVSCSESYGRILAEDVAAACDVPSFNRSPYDGYAFRAADTENASFDAPAVLKILPS